MSSPAPTSAGSMNQNERFFRYFKLEIAALRQQMSRLGDTALVGGERIDATEHFIAGIARLSNEVKDAVVYIPAYDQRKYTEEIQALNSEFQATRAAFAPKPKFSFKTPRKNASAISLADAEALASEQRLHIPGYDSHTPSSSAQSSMPPSPGPKPPMVDNTMRVPERAAQAGQDHKPSSSSSASQSSFFTSPSNISVSNHTNKHLILPLSTTHAPATTATLSHLTRCIVNMSSPNPTNTTGTSTNTNTPNPTLTSLTLTKISSSLLILPPTNGPLHATALQNTVLVARCAQLRLHASANVDVYLAVRSRPVIELCTGVRVAPLPAGLLSPGTEPSEAAGDADANADTNPAANAGSNLWAQVDDFQWPRAGQSPNWSVLPEGERVPERVWREVVPGGPGAGVEEILGAVGIAVG